MPTTKGFRSFRVSLALATVALVVLSAVVLALAAKPAQASFPGTPNGTIIFECEGIIEYVGPNAVKTGEQDICAMNADGTEQQRLTTHARWEQEPAWSPDFKKIAYACNYRDGRGDLDICVMNADGTGEQVLTPDSTTPYNSQDQTPTWSHDGKQIAFQSDNGGAERDIYVMNADGTNKKNITSSSGGNHVSPAWSPDGTKIAFSSYRGDTYDANGKLTPNSDIYVINADGTGSETRLTDHPMEDFEANWSPDGKQIVFTGHHDQVSQYTWDYDVFVMNADGSEETNLTPDPPVDSGEGGAAWSPDGKKIVYQGYDGEGTKGHKIYTMNPDGTNKQQLPAGCFEAMKYLQPDWGVGSVSDGKNCGSLPPSDEADTDGDGEPDSSDNCPDADNSDQKDSDNDGTGDVCDSTPNGDDTDGDGEPDSSDNCPNDENPNQEDADGDGTGDVCDATPDGPDDDSDGLPNSKDNCSTMANPDQIDSDKDGKGDACDTDKDGDGVSNVQDPQNPNAKLDNCPDTPNATQEDADNDGVGDACETNLPGRMNGGGSATTSDGEKVTHGFELNCDAARTPNTLQVNWGGNTFHMDKLSKALCGDNPSVANSPNAKFDTFTGEGEGKLNGDAGATANWSFADAGEPGSNDTVRLVIKDSTGKTVLDVQGKLNKGNHQALHEKGIEEEKKKAQDSDKDRQQQSSSSPGGKQKR